MRQQWFLIAQQIYVDQRHFSRMKKKLRKERIKTELYVEDF